jgi:hypothetical protein
MLVLHEGEWGVGGGGGALVCPYGHPSSPTSFFTLSLVVDHCCGHPSSLPHRVIVIHRSPSLSCGCRCVLSMPKVAESEVTWWWLVGVTKATGHCGY